MGFLTDAYNDFLKLNGLTERNGIMRALEALEDGKSVIIKAPTGYGKTTLTRVLAKALADSRNDLYARVIHVLPLRSIVQDLYRKLLSDKDRGLISVAVAAQDMDFHDSPFFIKRITVTTLDTFALNLFKIPPVEMKNLFNNFKAHYELPRGMIYSSIVIFDEFHLLGEEGKPLTAALAALKALSGAGVPVVVASATIDDSLMKLLYREIPNIRDFVVIEDPSFDDNREVMVRLIGDPIADAEKLVREGKRVLMVFNTRRDAVDAYQQLKSRGLQPVLIHSKFTRSDRMRKTESILDGKSTRLVISTQVVEAGVDTSFDVVITEAAPPHNIIQRAGRVARYGGRGELHVFPFSGAVYDKDEVDMVYRSLKDGEPLHAEELLKLSTRNYEGLVSWNLLHDLAIIDESPWAHGGHAKRLYEALCGLTRETPLVPGVVDHGSSYDVVPLTEEEACGELRKTGKYFTAAGVVQDKPEGLLRYCSYENPCLEVKFLIYGIYGVAVSDYDGEVGLKL
ncbi:CRISPR-associated helicase Cas3' [Acidilobus sp.]|uniref:CRISPR-associated helicase Cas3' n=1 Tax=Acidilobus sp. TaxID=1872109 RepID=UPI003D05E9F6